MGVVVAEVVFDGRAPDLSRIADKVTERSGLPASFTESAAEVKGELFDLHGYLAFACDPETRLELSAYRAGAVKAFYEQAFGDARLPIAPFVAGLDEAPGTQTVFLRGYVGQEPTLLFVTELALEALGGRPRDPIPEEVRRAYGSPITAAQLEARLRKVRRQARGATLLVVLLLPVILPLWLVGLALFVVTLPWRIWKAYRLSRAHAEGSGGPA